MKELNLNNKFSLSVEDILKKCNPKVNIDEIASTGGIINSYFIKLIIILVDIIWDCNL